MAAVTSTYTDPSDTFVWWIEGDRIAVATLADILISAPPRLSSINKFGVPHLKIVKITKASPPRGNRYLKDK